MAQQSAGVVSEEGYVVDSSMSFKDGGVETPVKKKRTSFILRSKSAKSGVRRSLGLMKIKSKSNSNDSTSIWSGTSTGAGSEVCSPTASENGMKEFGSALEDRLIELESKNKEMERKYEEQKDQIQQLVEKLSQTVTNSDLFLKQYNEDKARHDQTLNMLWAGISCSSIFIVLILGLSAEQDLLALQGPLTAAVLYSVTLYLVKTFVQRFRAKTVLPAATPSAKEVAELARKVSVGSIDGPNRPLLRKGSSRLSDRSGSSNARIKAPMLLGEHSHNLGLKRQPSMSSMSDDLESAVSSTSKTLVSPVAAKRTPSVVPRGRLGSVVNEDYNITCNAWLNFFEGMDVKVEDIPYYKDLTADQRMVYREFRRDFLNTLGGHDGIDRMKPYSLPDDMSILRFLMADKFDTKLAMKRLLDTVAWRQKINLPKLVSDPPAVLELYRKLRVRRFMGFDKEKRPIFAERIGEFVGALTSSEAKAISHQDYLHCYVYEMGQFIQQFRQGAANGSPVWKQTYVADCKGMKWLPAVKSVGLLKSFAKDVEIHFPEQAGPIFVINVPSVVASAWKMIKQFLDPVVISKIKIYNHAPTDVLLEYIDKDVLFREYGGLNDADYPHVGDQ